MLRPAHSDRRSYRQFGWPVEEATAIATGGEHRQRFRNMIFARVVCRTWEADRSASPTRSAGIRELGLLEFEALRTDDMGTSAGAVSSQTALRFRSA